VSTNSFYNVYHHPSASNFYFKQKPTKTLLKKLMTEQYHYNIENEQDYKIVLLTFHITKEKFFS